MTVSPVGRDTATADFFDATARGELLIHRCADCGRHSPPPARSCAACQSGALLQVPARGLGRLLTWSIVHRKDRPPTVVGIVELDEGPWLHANIDDVDPEAIAAGQRLEVGYAKPPEESETIPLFHPSRGRRSDDVHCVQEPGPVPLVPGNPHVVLAP